MRATPVLYALIALFALCVPWFGIYPVFMMKLLCFAMFACAYNLLLGYGRMLSFGHAAFSVAARSRAPRWVRSMTNQVPKHTTSEARMTQARYSGRNMKCRFTAPASAAGTG